MDFWKINKEHMVFIIKDGFVLHGSLTRYLQIKIMGFMHEFLYALNVHGK